MNWRTTKKIFMLFSLGLSLSYSVKALSFDAANIVINIPALELSLYHNEKLIHRFPIAVGSPSHETPVGFNEIKKIVWNPWWFPPDSAWAINDRDTPPGPDNPLGPVKMLLNGDLRLHGTNNELTIGFPLSHGCIRMFNNDAITLAWWIQAHYTKKTSPALLAGYQAQKNQSYTIDLDSPLPVEIRYDLVELGSDLLTIHPDIYRKMSHVKELIYAVFEAQGVNHQHINKTILARFLHCLKKESISISITELFTRRRQWARK